MFDLDGTLVDTMSVILNNYVETIHSLGGPRVPTRDVLARFHTGPTPVLLRSFLHRSITPEDLDHYYAGYRQAIAGLQPFAGVVDMLQSLEARGYALGLFTSAARRAVDILFAQTGLGVYFNTVVAGDDVTEMKPAPEGLLLSCGRLSVGPHEMAYVGDADVDLACARQAGALGVYAAWGSDGDVSGYEEIARDPGDVIRLLRRHS